MFSAHRREHDGVKQDDMLDIINWSILEIFQVSN